MQRTRLQKKYTRSSATAWRTGRQLIVHSSHHNTTLGQLVLSLVMHCELLSAGIRWIDQSR